MKVTLINYTPNAATLLCFTKQTRLNMTPGLYSEVDAWSEERKFNELCYMARTIPSSWEFVDYTFLIEGVSRAFTHQFVRTRTGKYAQQTMRVLQVSSEEKPFDYVTGPTTNHLFNDKTGLRYAKVMAWLDDEYRQLIKEGATIEDARGILPTNIATNIIAKFDLRTLSEMATKRGSARTQGEYREVMAAMFAAVEVVHPWSLLFLRPKKHTVVDRLMEIAGKITALGYTSVSRNVSNELIKEAEILQRELT